MDRVFEKTTIKFIPWWMKAVSFFVKSRIVNNGETITTFKSLRGKHYVTDIRFTPPKEGSQRTEEKA